LSAEEYNPKPQGYSKTKRAVVKVGKCIGPLYDTLSQYDRINTVPATAGQHHCAAVIKDLKHTLTKLQKLDPFNEFPGHTHKSFPKVGRDS